MKITVDVDENYIENEVVIKCSEINDGDWDYIQPPSYCIICPVR